MGAVNLNLGQFEILLYLLIGMLLGAVIGWEREVSDKPAGLRTHMLVAGASTLLVALADLLVTSFGVTEGTDLVRSDPIRILEAVITGVSFLGAGTIIRQGGEAAVRGLTTAASLLFAAVVGICVALSQFIVAIGATVLVLLTLRGLGYLEGRMGTRKG